MISLNQGRANTGGCNHGRLPPALWGLVQNVVMEQGSLVNHLHGQGAVPEPVVQSIPKLLRNQEKSTEGP